MWNILDPNTGVNHTIFAGYEALSQEQVAKYSAIIADNPRFRDSSMFLIESARFIKPKPAPKAPKQNPGFFKDCTCQSKDTPEDANESLTVESKKTLTLTLAAIAMALHKPTYPLESPGDRQSQLARTYLETFIKPNSLVKGVASVVTFPFGFLFFAMPHIQNVDRETKTFGKLFEQENLDPALKKLEDHPIIDKHLNRERTWNWLYQGSHGQSGLKINADNVPTYETGLIDLLHDPRFASQTGGAFIEVTAAHVFDKEQGLLKVLADNGFVCTPVNDWKSGVDIENMPKRVENHYEISLRP